MCSSSGPVAAFSSGWLWLLRCLGRRRITSGHGTCFGVVLWSEVQLSASVPGTTRTRGPARYRRDMDQLRPPLPQRLRPAHWVGIDCAVTAVMALAYALIFRETADLRGIPYWASPAIVAVTVLPAAFRRYWPRTVLALVVAGGAVATAVSRNPDLPPLAVAFVMYLIPLRFPRRDALQTGSAGGCLRLGPGRQIVSQDNPSGVSRFGGQAGTRSPTLRPSHRKTSEAGPEHLPTSSLPTRCGWPTGSWLWRVRSYPPVMRALRTSKRFGTCWLRRIGGWRAWHARTRRERW